MISMYCAYSLYILWTAYLYLFSEEIVKIEVSTIMSIKIVLVLLLVTLLFVASQNSNQIAKQRAMNAMMQLMKKAQHNSPSNAARTRLNIPFASYAVRKVAPKWNIPFAQTAVRPQVKPYQRQPRQYYKPTQRYPGVDNWYQRGNTGNMDMNNLMAAYYMNDVMDLF